MGRVAREKHRAREKTKKSNALPAEAFEQSISTVNPGSDTLNPTDVSPDLRVQRALHLPDSYQERKAAQAGIFSFFAPSNPERLEEINFITLIATHLSDQSNAAQLIEGAYIYVMQDIENAYSKAWWSKDAKASQLYLELSEGTTSKTSDEKTCCLEALSLSLQEEETKKKLAFTSERTTNILTKIDAQVDALKATASAALIA